MAREPLVDSLNQILDRLRRRGARHGVGGTAFGIGLEAYNQSFGSGQLRSGQAAGGQQLGDALRREVARRLTNLGDGVYQTRPQGPQG